MLRLIGKVNVMNRDFVYIYCPIFNYLWGVLLSAGHTDTRLSRLDHCATRTAQRLSRAVGPFELYEHLWCTCLATPDPVYVCLPLDVSHMSRIVTGAKSWNMMSSCPVHDCYSLPRQGCLWMMAMNKLREISSI